MYKKRIISINGKSFISDREKVKEMGTVIEAEAGTTGLLGGVDRETGGRAYFSLEVLSGDNSLRMIEKDGHLVGFEIAVCSDDGIVALIEALSHALKTLVDQSEDDEDCCHKCDCAEKDLLKMIIELLEED